MKSKKEIKDSFKEIKLQIGVFQIRNMINHKIYIESSTNLASIWNRHLFQLNSGLHPNKELQDEWTVFGQENFAFEILCEIKQDDTKTTDHYRKEAKQFEAMFIEELQPYGEKGYNTVKLK